MSSPSVPVAARCLVATSVAVVQALLLGVLSLGPRGPAPDTGGAPVIELSLQPLIAFDGIDGGETAASAARADAAPTPAPAPSPPEIAPRPVPDPGVAPEIVVRTDAASTPAIGAATETVAIAGQAAPTVAAAQSRSAASADARRGQTRGGGAPTIGASAGRSSDDYEAQILRWIEQHKGNAGGNLGVVTVQFTLDRRGRLSGEAVLRTSGHAGLDAFSLNKLRQAAPFPRPPASVTWPSRDFVVNIDYRRRT